MTDTKNAGVSDVKTAEHTTWCASCRHYYGGKACPVCGKSLLLG